MNKLLSKLLQIVVALYFLLLFGCATTSKETVLEVKNLVKERQFDKALAIIESDKFYPEERSRLLKLLEQGTVKYFSGQYYQASKIFYDAQELSNQLYTVSVSKKALTGLSNDNADNYYGEKYERSLIRFYFALSHFMIYQTGIYEEHTDTKIPAKGEKAVSKLIAKKSLSESERRTHLFAAKAAILEWDTLMESYKNEQLGKSVYKVDLAARIFGAFIHEQFGTSSDNQVALQLYKDAKEILFKNYNTYAVFNKSSDLFRKNFDKLPTMNREEVAKKFVMPTVHAENLLQFIESKIATLSQNKRVPQVTFLFQNSMVTEKTENEIKLPVDLGVGMSDGANFGQFVSMVFSTGRGGILDIAIKLPKVSIKPTNEKMELVAKSSDGKEYKSAAIIIDPISEIAYEAFDNAIAGITTKTVARLTVKYVAALSGAYSIYRKDKAGGLAAAVFARMAIGQSEGADLRYWSTLPHDLRFSTITLPPGEYELFVNHISNQSQITTTLLGKQTIKEMKKDLLIPVKVN